MAFHKVDVEKAMKQITELYSDFYDNVIKIVNAYQCFDQPYQNQEEF